MKPHEETWVAGADEDADSVESVSPEGWTVFRPSVSYQGNAVAAAKLAAAAPDMARALLAVERMPTPRSFILDHRSSHHCGGCWASWRDGAPPRHDDTCPVDAALRKAGVR